jgi:hypothetical protein
MKLDTQAIEILGRNRLVSELLRAGIEVAFPIRDRGIDLIAFSDRKNSSLVFAAVPIQMKGAERKSFSIDKKYEKVPHLLFAYVWGIQEEEIHKTFAMTYQEAFDVAEEMGYTKTESWTKNDKYAVSKPGKKLERLIREFQMTPEKWRARLER